MTVQIRKGGRHCRMTVWNGETRIRSHSRSSTFWAAQLASTGLCAAVIHIAQQHDKVVLPEKKKTFSCEKSVKILSIIITVNRLHFFARFWRTISIDFVRKVRTNFSHFLIFSSNIWHETGGSLQLLKSFQKITFGGF